MPYMIQFVDKPDYGRVRAQWRGQHLNYLHANELLAAVTVARWRKGFFNLERLIP